MDWDRPAGKRRRTDEEDACEAIAALLRQTAARAMDRVRMQRQQRGWESQPTALSAAASAAVARSVKPMDILVIRFCTHYLDCSTAASPTQFMRLAQEVVTSSIERIFVPQLYNREGSSLPALCEGLVAEHTAEDIQVTVKEVAEFVEARGALGAWIADATSGRAGEEDDDDNEVGGGGGSYGARDREDAHERRLVKAEDAEDDNDDEDDGEEDGADLDPSSTTGANRDDFALATAVYQACEFWVRVQAFLNALSLHSASLHIFVMPMRYERELLNLLYTVTRGGGGGGGPQAAAHAGAVAATSTGGAPPQLLGSAKTEKEGAVKQEPLWEGDVTVLGEADGDDADDGDAPASPRPPQQLYRASALLADVLALSRCPSAPAPDTAAPSAPSLSSSAAREQPRISAEASQQLRGLNANFYKMVYARLGIMVARDRLHRFDRTSAVAPPPLTVQQGNLEEQLELQKQQQQQQQPSALSAAALGVPGQSDTGLPAAYVPDDAYYEKLLHQQHDTIDEDEEVYKGEVMDYYLSHPNRPNAATSNALGSSRGRGHRGNGGADDAPLMKPHRFCKVKTGFTWTQYNRTHYDSRTNPPPRTEMWYEFTIFYPALANTKRDMRTIFRIEDAPEGPNDQYCLLVFSVGPPYADVAYRIRKKQWDTRRGGVRISFDQYGRYKLFFRFTNSNYRR